MQNTSRSLRDLLYFGIGNSESFESELMSIRFGIKLKVICIIWSFVSDVVRFDHFLLHISFFERKKRRNCKVFIFSINDTLSIIAPLFTKDVLRVNDSVSS
jgi:hypothetical protein